MAVRNLLNALHVAGIAVYMDRNNGGSLLRDQALQFVHVDGIVFLIDIAEYRSQAVAHDGMGGGGKAERGRDDLARQLHSLQRQLQRHMTIHKQLQIRCFQICFQFFL